VAADLRRELDDLGTVVRLTSTTPADRRSRDGDDVAVDPHDVLAHALGLAPDRLTLVRPDGYVGLAAASATPEALRGYLADTLRVQDPAPV
jgi:hypothetical protein